MKFKLDNQTKNDLGLLDDDKSSSQIFKFFNYTKTKGGEDFLYDLMNTPSTDIIELQDRSELINYLYDKNFSLNIDHKQFDLIKHYLKLNIPPLKNNFIDAYLKYISYKLKPSNDHYLINTGIKSLLSLIQYISNKINELDSKLPNTLKKEIYQINQIVEHPDFKDYFNSNFRLSIVDINKLDNLFRKKHTVLIKKFINTIYHLDAYISVAKAAKENRLTFPKYIESKSPKLSIKKLYHPLLPNAVPYDIEIDEEHNMCFLTGPNMAGKSTFLKTLGLSVILSHIGFPIPAEELTTSIYYGIITTINLSDNLKMGQSHFYSEVKRVKDTALMLKEKNRLFVIFDELFRGTNVKDAYDASLMIIKSLAKISKSSFFISTHITEVADDLKNLKNIDFKYFTSKLVDNKLVYEYKLHKGVSHERHGMLIVKNEQIVEILESVVN